MIDNSWMGPWGELTYIRAKVKGKIDRRSMVKGVVALGQHIDKTSFCISYIPEEENGHNYKTRNCDQFDFGDILSMWEYSGTSLIFAEVIENGTVNTGIEILAKANMEVDGMLECLISTMHSDKRKRNYIISEKRKY